MPAFLVHRDRSLVGGVGRNSNQRHAIIVSGADAAAAIAAARAASPDGETRVPDSWVALQLVASEDAEAAAEGAWFEGDVVFAGENFRGN